MKRLAIIDGKSVFYRGYYAMPTLATRDGTPTGGVYGFAALSLELMKKLKPDYVCVAWDKSHTNIRRRKALYEAYKAGRKPAPPDFYAQIPMLHELLGAFSWPLYEADDYEADDIMCTLAKKADTAGLETCLITSDLDALQCVSPTTHVYALKKGFSSIELFKPDSFEAKYGISVDQFLDLKSLKGDSSDNIPGVAGVGEKTAVQLLQDYQTLDGVYENLWQVKDSVRKKLEAGKDSAYLSRELATLYDDAPFELDLEAMDVTDLDTTKLKSLLETLEFRSLLRNLPDFMRVEGMLESRKETEHTRAHIVELDDTERAKYAAADTILMQVVEGELFVSEVPSSASSITAAEAENIFGTKTVVTHGGGTLCHYLLKHGVALPKTIFDVKHAAFLLDPLQKSREIVDLFGLEELSPEIILPQVWGLYSQQKGELGRLPKLERVAYGIDFPLIQILARMEHRGIILDTEFLSSMNRGLAENIASIRQKMYDMVGYEFNIASPAQLGEVLFTKLQLSTVGIKKGKTGYSTGQKELDKLRGLHPIIELIEQYRELTKLQNTYVEALPKLVDEKSRLHTTFNQDVAATGRLSSTDPNLQNIPIRSELGRTIRQAFVPDKGNVFVSADYSQFELRLAAVLAGDKDMINDFNAGTDIHAKTAAQVYGIPLDEVSKSQRRDAKVINFGVLYGMSPHGLAAATGMSFQAAKTFIDEYFKVRKPIHDYMTATIEKAKTDGYVETYFGRRRPTPDVRSSNFMVRAGAERAAANMPIQGTEADLMKMAMIAVEERLQTPRSAPLQAADDLHAMSNSAQAASSPAPRISSELKPSSPVVVNSGLVGWQVLQIHDSILIECPRESTGAVAEMLKSTMENIYPELGVRLDVDVTIGDNWGEV